MNLARLLGRVVSSMISLGGGGGGGFWRGIDEATLKQVSALTGGEYYAATNAQELQSVFQNLPTHLITKHETAELSVIFVAVGALFTVLALYLRSWGAHGRELAGRFRKTHLN
jgi:Ca-activated chloride channel family protein